MNPYDAIGLAAGAPMTDQARIAAARMVQSQLMARGIRDPAVLDAMRAVPRHKFVPTATIERAYSDHALPTTEGQTISQPYIVAHMTELLEVRPGMTVLEVGTGSGYQTAILARLGARVVTIERSDELARSAGNVLEDVCPDEPGGPEGPGSAITMVVADGTLGYPDKSPYDRILVTAAAPHVPEAYKTQLADPGRLVIPLGDRYSQRLTVIERNGDQLTQTDDITCRFVLLVGKDGWGD
jgi:protein-L-isoaspartate(D-aspartate) O-methyltransferase